jgi:hypothetical protein
MEKQRFSFSDIRTADECLFRLKERKAGRYQEPVTEAMLTGRYAHVLLEDNNEKISDFINNNAKTMLGNIGKKNEAIKVAYSSIERVAAAVKNTEIYESVKQNPKEQYLKADVSDSLEISGIIDVLKIDVTSKTIEIVDWKTATNFDDVWSKKYRTFEEWHENYINQIALYSWLVSKNFSEKYSDYSVIGKIVGFTKKEPVNFQFVTIDLGKLKDVENLSRVQMVLSMIANISLSINDDTLEDYYCNACECCINSQHFKKIEVQLT